jgi:hypothetical protein
MSGTVPVVACSIGWHEKASFLPRSMLGDQVFNKGSLVVQVLIGD